MFELKSQPSLHFIFHVVMSLYDITCYLLFVCMYVCECSLFMRFIIPQLESPHPSSLLPPPSPHPSPPSSLLPHTFYPFLLLLEFLVLDTPLRLVLLQVGIQLVQLIVQLVQLVVELLGPAGGEGWEGVEEGGGGRKQ